MNLADANLQYFAQVLSKFNDHGVRSYAKVSIKYASFFKLSLRYTIKIELL